MKTTKRALLVIDPQNVYTSKDSELYSKTDLAKHCEPIIKKLYDASGAKYPLCPSSFTYEEVSNLLEGLRYAKSVIHYKFNFDSVMITENDLQGVAHRLLEVDNRVIVPVKAQIRFIITSTDVLHSWAVPALGIKVDAVPGRLNQFVTEIKNPGVFYGQCSELCGPLHGFMPIIIEAVPYEDFEKWLILKANL